MQGFYTILLLTVSNIFMTFAWYGHLKLQEMKVISNWPLYAVILFSGELLSPNIHFKYRQTVSDLTGTEDLSA